MQHRSGGCIVHGDGSVHERRDSDEVIPSGSVGRIYKDSSGLPRGHKDGIGGEGLHIGRIHLNNHQFMTGYLEEELVVEGGVNDPEHVRLSRFHFQNGSP